MRKYLPYTPLLVLIVGVFGLHIYTAKEDRGILSNTLNVISGEVLGPVCTKPEGLTRDGESAWCQRGLVSDIKQERNLWNWDCILGEEIKKCVFEKTGSYPTHGSIFFSRD